MQKNKIMQCLKTLIRRLLWCMAAVVILYCSALYFLTLPGEVGDCELYTERLNGGVHNVGGTLYRVTLCGQWMSDPAGDPIRLQVHSMEGELLVERWFIVHWDSNFPRKVEYTKKGLTYYDPADENHFEKTIDLPPTRWDKLRARFL